MRILRNVPRQVRIVEVGPRDGLQNEPGILPAAAKIRFVEDLVAAGHRHVEVTSFVRPDRVPQLADAEAVLRGLRTVEGVTYTVLVPNVRGLERALAAGARSIAVFTAATETFSRKNAGCGRDASLAAIEEVARRARGEGLRVRGYISCAFDCPYEGAVDAATVCDLVGALRGMGIGAIALGDTLGKASPVAVDALLDALSARAASPDRALDGLALHLHDTHGRALVNALVGLAHGIEEFDASAGGLGGCPFAPGARGNLATEDLLGLLASLGIETGVDADRVRRASAALRGAAGGLQGAPH